MSSTPSTSTAVKRACDACHRRKVKCDGVQPCRNCSSAQLSCTYHAIPQKKGPKGSRAKVISELRETQRQTTLSSKVANRMNGIVSPPISPNLAPTPGMLMPEVVKECVEFFFNNVYPSMPIVHRQRFESMLPYVEQNIETYCMVTSLCAFVLVQPDLPMSGASASDPFGLDAMPGANMMKGHILMEEALRVRKAFDHLENTNLHTLTTNYFLFACYFSLELHNKAWFYLREASTLAHILLLHKEESYMQCDMVEATRRRRLYWLLFIAERAYALKHGHPLTLANNVNLPTINDDSTEVFPQPLSSFTNLAALFRPFDDAFLTLWRSALSSFSTEWMGMLQKQLSDRLPSYVENTHSQEQDLRSSQQWLRTMVWQLGMHNGHLGNSPEEASMTFGYPIEIARSIMEMTSQFSHQSIEGGAVRLLETLYSICTTLLPVLYSVPPSTDPFTLSPRDHLPSFLALISFLRSGDHRFLPLLLTKVHEIMPALASPMLRTHAGISQHDYKPQIQEMNNHFNSFTNNNPAHNTGMGHGGMNFDNHTLGGPKFPHAVMDHHPGSMGPSKRIEDLASPATMVGDSPNLSSGHSHQSPHHHGYSNASASPSIIPLSMDFPGMPAMNVNTNSYDGFPDHLSVGSSMSSGQISMSVGTLSSPMRQNSGSSWSSGIPRSVPEYEMPY
eukprot:GHVU01213547.1.p1 GENE.GHVU01213547.1~~GHVU01213547.1.p1  ORF type:complete len:705 (+),score=56.85 GHVU01213547.1:92-2116(+)